ncbi:replication-relaxation family protein [Frankia sp. KB5]|uniref:replication-relaxation family protein n=1 Tax=Frankia sp. KB5 TaxID=683318 RepID=UPI000A10A037|nr:replication-relaxation family protein [Frankia sp. KB5]ORT47647.1 hypothetical protein KBI5_18635 [Frankia sp. KB5]
MTPAAHPSKRVRSAHVEWVQERMAERDWQIVADVERLRLATGAQIERLHFTAVAPSARGRVRRLVLARLVKWRVLTTMERRIGGVRAGSRGLVFALDSAGQRLMQLDTARHEQPARVRRPGTVTERFVAHTLAVSELYVALREVERRTPGLIVEAFNTEPASWWPDGLGGWLKPDAYAALASAEFVDHCWVEVDRATESLPTVGRKLRAYLDFLNRGQLGPADLMPRVLVTVPDEARAEGVRREIRRLPAPGDELVSVALHGQAAEVLAAGLLTPDGSP